MLHGICKIPIIFETYTLASTVNIQLFQIVHLVVQIQHLLLRLCFTKITTLFIYFYICTMIPKINRLVCLKNCAYLQGFPRIFVLSAITVSFITFKILPMAYDLWRGKKS